MRQDLDLPLLDFIQIANATGNFSNKLGKGGFGTVYKVMIWDVMICSVAPKAPNLTTTTNFTSEI